MSDNRSTTTHDDDDLDTDAALTAAADEFLEEFYRVPNLADPDTATEAELFGDLDPDSASALLTATVAVWTQANGSTGDPLRDTKRCLVDLAAEYLNRRDAEAENQAAPTPGRIARATGLVVLFFGLLVGGSGCCDQWTVSYGPGPISPCVITDGSPSALSAPAHATPRVESSEPAPPPALSPELPPAPMPPAVGVRPSRLAVHTTVIGGVRSENLLGQ